MKKFFLSFAACLMCVSLLAACGGNASKPEGGSTSGTVTSSAVSGGDTISSEADVTSSEAGTTSSEAGTVSSEADEPSSEVSTAGTTTTGPYNTLEEFVNSEETQAEIQSVIDSMKDSGIDVAVTAEGNKLVYLYTYSESALEGVDMEALASTLDDALESSAGTFEGIAASLTRAVNIDDPVVVVTYAQPDGTTISTREFTAK